MPEHTPNTPDLQARSPWSTLTEAGRIQIHRLEHPVDGSLSVPGSKSFTNRALIVAALAEGHSRLSGILKSDDSYWCIEALRHLGVRVEVTGDQVDIDGCDGRWPVESGDLYLGASGTLARFLPGALAAAPFGAWRLDGSRRLRERPLAPLLTNLTQLGAQITSTQAPDALPLTLSAHGLSGGDLSISGDTSSQFISGLLLCAPYAAHPVNLHVTTPIVQHAYVRMTVELMRAFGASVSHSDDLREFRVDPVRYQPRSIELEADASTSCYFFALAAVTGGRVQVNNQPDARHQPDALFVDQLARMGCEVTRTGATVTVQGPPRTTAGPALKGGFRVSMKEMSDQAVTLAAVAAFADAPVTITDVAHIRAHESDRIAAMRESLERVGIVAEEHADGLTVHPGQPRAAELPSYDDHRIAMSLAVLAAAGNGGELLDPGCVSKTCPSFFDYLARLGVETALSRT